MVSSREREGQFDADVGEAALDAIMRWDEWIHRRVESVHPLDGDRGRIRHSIDCSPPGDARLAYDPRDRRRRLGRIDGSAMVPLAFVTKGPMRHLDTAGHDGAPLTLLTMRENLEISVSALSWGLTREGLAVNETVRGALRELVGPDGPALQADLEALLAEGTWRDVVLWPGGALSPELSDLLRDLSRNFLLTVLVPATQLGRRQVVKFSFHWAVRPLARRDRVRRPLAALGLTTLTLDIPMMNPADAESYHLEFRTPPELACVSLRLEGSSSAAATDTSGEPVAHAHGAFDNAHDSVAKVELRVRRQGAWRVTWAATGLTAVVSTAAVALPGASAVLRDAGNGGPAILLAAPALLIGLASARSESSLSSWLLTPLRFVNVAMALGLFAMAGSIVGDLISPLNDILWGAVAAAATTAFVTLSFGHRLMSTTARPKRYPDRHTDDPTRGAAHDAS